MKIAGRTSFQAVRAVVCAFTGIGKRKELEHHLGVLKPQHVIIAGSFLCSDICFFADYARQNGC
jgi:hypothetical protein